MKISFITTVYNEEKTILKFLDSLLQQTKIPDEIIIVDGGSTDDTLGRIKKQEARVKNRKIRIKVFIKPGNRSVGRNEAIKQASGEIIVCSDAGNELDKNWVRAIIKPFASKSVDVVAGYYEGRWESVFQKCVIPYALVMPDKVNPADFLPATRSIAFTKAIWKKVGKFDETLSHNEDYVFAKKLRAIGAKIVFAKDAIVYWQPRNSFKQAFIMMFRFAYGDAESGMYRPRVLVVFARYIFGVYLLFLSIFHASYISLFLLMVGFLVYLVYSIKKNYRYVNERLALVYLPCLQLTADAAVLIGTTAGAIKRVIKKNV